MSDMISVLAKQSEELMRMDAEIARLTAENERLRAALVEARRAADVSLGRTA